MAHPGRPALSVIVVTHDEREVVERCLPPLQAQLEDGDELIVADNRSTDGTADAVRRIAPSAQVIEMPSNDGYMAAANAALARATGDLLLTLDADAIVAPGFCDAIRRPAVDGRGWAAWMGLVTMDGGRLVNTSGGLLAKGHPIGATGVAQLTECWWQLRGEAGERQVDIRSGYALQHNAGGRGSGVSVVNILTNRAS